MSGEPKLEVGNEGEVDEVAVPELDSVAALGSEVWSGKDKPSWVSAASLGLADDLSSESTDDGGN